MMLSKTSRYALRAVLYLARHADHDQMARAPDVAEALDVPANYLSKILHSLGRTGLLVSERGPTGGFRLARPADRIALSEVVAAFDELRDDERCLLGREKCRDDSPCAAHDRWKAVAAEVYGFFDETTVADLLESWAAEDPTDTVRGGAHGAAR